MLTVPALVIGITAPFAGMIVDALDRKRLLIIALLGYAVAGTAPLYLPSLGAIIASRVLVGVCEAAIMTCCTTLITDYWSGARRSRYLSLQVLVATLSATVFLGLGGLLGTAGWRAPFWLYAVAARLAVSFVLDDLDVTSTATMPYCSPSSDRANFEIYYRTMKELGVIKKDVDIDALFVS